MFNNIVTIFLYNMEYGTIYKIWNCFSIFNHAYMFFLLLSLENPRPEVFLTMSFYCCVFEIILRVFQ